MPDRQSPYLEVFNKLLLNETFELEFTSRSEAETVRTAIHAVKRKQFDTLKNIGFYEEADDFIISWKYLTKTNVTPVRVRVTPVKDKNYTRKIVFKIIELPKNAEGKNEE